jgi:hypothetical protein
VPFHAVKIYRFSTKNSLHAPRNTADPAGNGACRRDPSTEHGVEGGYRSACREQPPTELVSSDPNTMRDFLPDVSKAVKLFTDEASKAHGCACLL